MGRNKSNALALEYQAEYGGACRNVDISNVRDYPHAGRIGRVFGPGFFEKVESLPLVESGSFDENATALAKLREKRLALEAERKMLDEAIAALERVVSQATVSQGQQPQISAGTVGGRQTPMGKPLEGKTIPESAKMLLGAVRRPLTNAQLAELMERNGFKHKSSDFPNTVGSVLRRYEGQHKDIARVGQQWHLTEWLKGANATPLRS